MKRGFQALIQESDAAGKLREGHDFASLVKSLLNFWNLLWLLAERSLFIPIEQVQKRCMDCIHANKKRAKYEVHTLEQFLSKVEWRQKDLQAPRSLRFYERGM